LNKEEKGSSALDDLSPLLFGLSESLRSVFFLHLDFPRRAEARKNEFWPFRVTRKHEKILLGLSAPRFSIKKRILVFPRRAEA
jgi:hypothetical protein